jgi:hypothetical protein
VLSDFSAALCSVETRSAKYSNEYVALTAKLYKPIHTQRDSNLKDRDLKMIVNRKCVNVGKETILSYFDVNHPAGIR